MPWKEEKELFDEFLQFLKGFAQCSNMQKLQAMMEDYFDGKDTTLRTFTEAGMQIIRIVPGVPSGRFHSAAGHVATASASVSVSQSGRTIASASSQALASVQASSHGPPAHSRPLLKTGAGSRLTRRHLRDPADKGGNRSHRRDSGTQVAHEHGRGRSSGKRKRAKRSNSTESDEY